jgi:uncharacterized protein (TIGR02246 family)
MRKLLVCLPLLVLLAACRCTECGMSADDPAAHLAHEAYVEAINSNDVERMLDVMTDDVVFMAPGAPVMVGKDVIRPWIEGYVEWCETHWEKPVREFVVDGDWAWERYDWASTDTPRDGSPVVRDTGWGLVVYHRDADGVWRVARDAWGTDHPAE